ncbi:FAD/NAD(P)-binding protein [Phytohabitans houttuyneae]|uniref:Oxidoreductase n=1 Tax=Phytohabitans houttuyneae TaxID=1076126 RepID=A0A6V8KHV7_9ACTN|nr:FAD/NAD(P)-binding protein [Phytohabitans houttuyneae]GFJ81679.1 oxidoreductase [Phytohabitans houttuyneae]
MTDLMLPLPYRVTARRLEATDTVTLTLAPVGEGIGTWEPGQFTMLYGFGVGEVPISISGGDGGRIHHTVRDVGAVSHALCGTGVGGRLGVRGPYGHGWDPDSAEGNDLLLVAGGIGLAPLRPVLTWALARRERYGRIALLVGARTPADLLYPREYPAWRAAGVQLLVTVDRADAGWGGHVGVVTTLVDQADFAPDNTVAFVCGPEPMMRFTARALGARGVPDRAVRVSLERNMRCGIALCGHCQLGPLLVCRDGPVASYDVAGQLLDVKEL